MISLDQLLDRVVTALNASPSGSASGEPSTSYSQDASGSAGSGEAGAALVWHKRYAIGLNLSAAESCPNADGIWRIVMPGQLTMERTNRAGSTGRREIALCYLGDLPAEAVARESLLQSLAEEIEAEAARWLRRGGPLHESGGPLCVEVHSLAGVSAGYSVQNASANTPTFAGGLGLTFVIL